MTRIIDSANYTAFQNAPEEGGIYRKLVTIYARATDGSPLSPYCFWNGLGEYQIPVVDPKTGLVVNRNFVGDGSVLEIDSITYSQGLMIKSARVVLSPIHTTVRNMFSGTDIRNARTEIHVLQISPSTGNVIGPALVLFVGMIDKAPLTLQGVGADSDITIDVASRTRVLTRSVPSKKSDEWMKSARNGDRFRRYNDTANVRIWWGQEKDTPAKNTGGATASKYDIFNTSRTRVGGWR